MGHPANLSATAPGKCCQLKLIYDQAAEAKCVQQFQNTVSNVNIGVKGKFDGLEVSAENFMN